MIFKKKISNYTTKIVTFISSNILQLNKKNVSSCISCEQYSSIIEKCDKLFLEKKLFLNSNLTLNQLAKEIGTNRTYLSISIKSIKNQSFSEYINSNRIEYSKIIIKEKLSRCEVGKDNSGMTTEDYAIASGFSSGRNFVRCFKLKEGVTPTQYKNAILWKVRK